MPPLPDAGYESPIHTTWLAFVAPFTQPPPDPPLSPAAPPLPPLPPLPPVAGGLIPWSPASPPHPALKPRAKTNDALSRTDPDRNMGHVRSIAARSNKPLRGHSTGASGVKTEENARPFFFISARNGFGPFE